MSKTVTGRHGRTFVLNRTMPHTTKDGRDVELGVWVGTCKTCGGPFEVIAPSTTRSGTNNHKFDLANCEEHRLKFSKAS